MSERETCFDIYYFIAKHHKCMYVKIAVHKSVILDTLMYLLVHPVSCFHNLGSAGAGVAFSRDRQVKNCCTLSVE